MSVGMLTMFVLGVVFALLFTSDEGKPSSDQRDLTHGMNLLEHLMQLNMRYLVTNTTTDTNNNANFKILSSVNAT